MENVITDEAIVSKIYFIREQKVMLDKDLAVLYQVETKVFNQAVKRNMERFPADFMFQLTEEEFENLRSQIVTSSWGGPRYLPYAFTEQGVAMLSSVLKSEVAIQVNIQIIRLFTRMRELLSTSQDILLKLADIEKRVSFSEENIQAIFACLKELLTSPKIERNKIGFKSYD
ncbi:MAG TPA: ORF6N domain-containing protein [Chitinophagaceae bacterium]|nr:ORF6N domain-containing protein [Chitinophagaceae bacterium]